MASAVNFPQCDHLRSITALNVFSSERAKLIHFNEQLSSLDRHIAELNTLRSTLHHRTLQLHNQLSLIHTLPIEVLSYVFQLAVSVNYVSPCYRCYRLCLRRAFVLSSVSSHFRLVAFSTPKLWNRISLYIAEGKAIDKVSSLLQHCIARVSNGTICIFDEHPSYVDTGHLRSVIGSLLTSDTTRKVKAFHLHDSNNVSPWISKLDNSSFPMIETLDISCETQPLSGFDFGTLNNLTRLSISGTGLDFPIVVPPSVQYLKIAYVSENAFVSLLYQCPNLVECYADIANKLRSLPLTKPLVLNHLKQLHTGSTNFITMSSSLQHLQLPSLEFLRLGHYTQRYFDIVPFCSSVSASLTSLTILTRLATLDYEGLYQLCRSTFPKLRVLKIDSVHFERLLGVIRALSPLAGERNNPKPLHLPALESITLRSSSAIVEPRIILDSLKNWWSDEALRLHFELQNRLHLYEDWTPALEEEFRLIKGSRQIEITWGDGKI